MTDEQLEFCLEHGPLALERRMLAAERRELQARADRGHATSADLARIAELEEADDMLSQLQELHPWHG